ncbi:MAG: hypothetical protein ASARMPREDX12_006956 [Alectoria sarmentosa]|nr:MAG: hypothetical protein ASARMPREDX12_006956 [Alectoria sarmentosa]
MADHCCPVYDGKSDMDGRPIAGRIHESKLINLENPLANAPAKHIHYYTPRQRIPAGSAIVPQVGGASIPKVFQPLKLRGLILQNRIMMSPLCQYSAEDGHLTDRALTHLGGILERGPGLAFVEATAVAPNGRITPEDSGLWKDSQIAPLKKIVDFAHGQGQNIALQLCHAGRKGNTVAPWIDRKAGASTDVGGWPDEVISVSTKRFDTTTYVPKAMTSEEIEEFKWAWVCAVRRGLKAGFDIPDSMPLFVRMPASDWMEHEPELESWDIKQATALAKALVERGVDFLDVSSGGLVAAQKITAGPGYQAPFSEEISLAVKGSGVAVGVVGMIFSGEQAEELLSRGVADAVVVGKGFMKNPALVWSWAEELGVEVRVANQIGWAFGQKADRGVLEH